MDWSHFTPWSSLIGGCVLGVAASALILLNGRILGVCGILASVLRRDSAELPWRLSLLAGLVVAPWLLHALAGMWPAQLQLPAPRVPASWPRLAIAGVLVGTGTRYANGCTSGHGICGLARLSPRSAVATFAFMASDFGTVFVMNHLLFIG